MTAKSCLSLWSPSTWHWLRSYVKYNCRYLQSKLHATLYMRTSGSDRENYNKERNKVFPTTKFMYKYCQYWHHCFHGAWTCICDKKEIIMCGSGDILNFFPRNWLQYKMFWKKAKATIRKLHTYFSCKGIDKCLKYTNISFSGFIN